MPPAALLKQSSSDLNTISPEKRARFETLARQKSKVLRMTKILEDFSASVLLLKKRS